MPKRGFGGCSEAWERHADGVGSDTDRGVRLKRLLPLVTGENDDVGSATDRGVRRHPGEKDRRSFLLQNKIVENEVDPLILGR